MGSADRKTKGFIRKTDKKKGGYNEKEAIISNPERSHGRYNADRLRIISIISITRINAGKS
jgi:hypothetical protein